MLGLDVIEVMTPSGHPSIINKITKMKFFVFQEEELRVVTERLEVIKRDKLNNQQTTRELEMEKRSQRIDINKNNASRAEVEQSQEDRKKILELEEKDLTEEDDKNAADIGEEGNLIWQIPFIFCQIFGK